tara:strand:+ start:1330 stop:2097 length:768 start_codon:yes stop_codon:yes gene_type:complete
MFYKIKYHIGNGEKQSHKKLIYKNYLDMSVDEITYKLIEENNDIIIEELKEKLKDYDTIYIIGKGDTATYIDKENTVGINQAIIFTKFNFLFLNDFLSFNGLDEYIKKIKYIFIPDYPHNFIKSSSLGRLSSDNFNYKNVIKYLKDNFFQGKVFFYQIQTTKSSKTLKHKFESKTSSDLPVQFFSKFLQKKKYVCYGIGVTNKYHPDLKKLKFDNTNKFFENNTREKLNKSVSYKFKEHMESFKQSKLIDEIQFH